MSTTNKDLIKVDTHSHTCFSGDSTTTLNEFIESAYKANLDFVAVTDHSSIEGALKLKSVEDKLNFKIIIGQEQTIPEGELIGLFINQRILPGLGLIDTAKSIKDQGGLVVVPHPCDAFRRSLNKENIILLAEHGLIDAIETFNSKTKNDTSSHMAAKLADDLNIAGTAGSDSHVPEAFGSTYLLMEHFKDAIEFKERLNTAQIIGNYCDPVRRWTSRLVDYSLNLSQIETIQK